MDGATSTDDRGSLGLVPSIPTGTYAGAGSYFWFVLSSPVFFLWLMISSFLDLVWTMYRFFGIRKVVRNSMNWHTKKKKEHYMDYCNQYSYKDENKNCNENRTKGWGINGDNYGTKMRLIAVTTKTFGALLNNLRLSLFRLCTFRAAAKPISVTNFGGDIAEQDQLTLQAPHAPNL